MSEATEKAKRIIDGASGRPSDYDLRVAEALAAVAQAEATERIAEVLETAARPLRFTLGEPRVDQT